MSCAGATTDSTGTSGGLPCSQPTFGRERCTYHEKLHTGLLEPWEPQLANQWSDLLGARRQTAWKEWPPRGRLAR